jgi:hypothetical protein
LAGLNGKSLKIFDTKVKAKAIASVNTKLVYNFCKDTSPNGNQDQAVSFYEKMIALWDLRMFKEPVNYMNENDVILKIQWCQRRYSDLNSCVVYVLNDRLNFLFVFDVKCRKIGCFDSKLKRNQHLLDKG